jgi:hypothetical protein
MPGGPTPLPVGFAGAGRPARVGLIVDKWAHVETLTVQAA